MKAKEITKLCACFLVASFGVTVAAVSTATAVIYMMGL